MKELQKLKIFRSLLVLPALLFLFASCSARKSSVAVVVDRQTYEAVSEAVDNYINAITTSEREGVLVVDIWRIWPNLNPLRVSLSSTPVITALSMNPNMLRDITYSMMAER